MADHPPSTPPIHPDPSRLVMAAAATTLCKSSAVLLQSLSSSLLTHRIHPTYQCRLIVTYLNASAIRKIPLAGRGNGGGGHPPRCARRLSLQQVCTTATATTGNIVAPPLRTCCRSIWSAPPGGSWTALAPLHPPRSSSLKCGGGGRIQSSVSYPLHKVCTRVYGERIDA